MATSITIKPINAALGAVVECNDLRRFDATEFALIRAAWLEHLVLVIRGQTLSDDDLLAFGRRFGELDDTQRPQPGQQLNSHQGALTIVSNVVENGKAIGALGNGDLVWHTDASYIEIPPDASVLYALEVPKSGGDTGFCNMYLALETLPQDLRARINGLTVKHDATHNSAGILRAGVAEPADVSVSPGPRHPVVRTHPETGCDALFLGRRPYAHATGLAVHDSEALLDALWAHAANPAFAWYHQWQPGDVVIWDNRCTMHRRDAFDDRVRRVMHRTQVRGSPPICHTGLGVRKVHPRSKAAARG